MATALVQVVMLHFSGSTRYWERRSQCHWLCGMVTTCVCVLCCLNYHLCWCVLQLNNYRLSGGERLFIGQYVCSSTVLLKRSKELYITGSPSPSCTGHRPPSLKTGGCAQQLLCVSVSAHLAGKTFATDADVQQTVTSNTVIHAVMPGLEKYFDVSDNYREFYILHWLHGDLMCIICYPCATYHLKPEWSSWHLSFCLLHYFFKLLCSINWSWQVSQ
jgi:hypothetical protein